MSDLKLREVTVEREIAGRKLSISTGLLAKQAAGAVVVRYGDTMVLTAATTQPPRFPDQDFFPLAVDYREKTYAAGKFPGGFFKREKAPSTKETLTMRLADRPLRPLFPEGFRQEVLIQSIVLSADLVNDPDILSMIGASASLHLSQLPFAGPVGAVRMGMKDGRLLPFPTIAEADESSLNLVLAGTASSVMMVESGAKEISEEKMLEALEKAHEVVKVIVEMQEELRRKADAPAKMVCAEPPPPSCLDAVRKQSADRLRVALCTPGKFGRREAARAVCSEVVKAVAKPKDQGGPEEAEVKAALDVVKTEVIRDLIKKNTRVDGRDRFTVRPIDCRLGLLPRVHGSALFTRGETQGLVTITLGSASDTQRVDGLREAYEEQWYIHYNAPGFSVGEAKMPRGPGRREIGHGMLAQRALDAVMPHDTGFPYTVRAVSEILEMNGSSSMATVCGATLALMDAGVPIKKPVAGIAMGLIQDPGEEPVVVTDILGDEDHYGDMDFKVCGTDTGITALQMDIKITGISTETMRKALAQAREGRLHILRKMGECIAAPRPEISPIAPRIHSVFVPIDLLGKIIGPGGKTIRQIQEQTGTSINIEDTGEVQICAPDGESLQKAVLILEGMVAVPEVGATYEGKVTGIREFGCFVEILPGTEGMCHVSELAYGFVKKVEDVVKVGDVVQVKVLTLEDNGKIRLSRKALLPVPEGYVPPEPSERGDRPPRREGGRDRDRRGPRRD